MAGAFAKGGTPLTPAQQQLQQMAVQNAQHFESVYLPIQDYFASKTREEAPYLKEQARGEAASGAREAGLQGTEAELSSDVKRGAGEGSGHYLTDLTAGLDTTGAAAGKGLAVASGAADQHYVEGLQKILGYGTADQRAAMSGLESAAQTEGEESAAYYQNKQEQQQGFGQLAGLGLTLALPSSAPPKPTPAPA